MIPHSGGGLAVVGNIRTAAQRLAVSHCQQGCLSGSVWVVGLVLTLTQSALRRQNRGKFMLQQHDGHGRSEARSQLRRAAPPG